MPIYEITPDNLREIPQASFPEVHVRERRDLQRLLRRQVDVIAANTLIIAEEFGEWEDSRRRIDLLGIDKDANLVVIELKRTESGGRMELQALRYAAMVSTMTFDEAAEVLQIILSKTIPIQMPPLVFWSFWSGRSRMRSISRRMCASFWFLPISQRS